MGPEAKKRKGQAKEVREIFEIKNGKKLFLHGDSETELAKEAALSCPDFSKDCDEECFYEDDVSCYNCRYRRWMQDGFECLK